MPDIAHQHQRAAGQGQRRAVGLGEGAISFQLARERPAALGDVFLEVALHQPQPVAVDDDLVLGIDRRNRVLAVHDRGDRRFEDNVGNAGRIGLTDRRRRIEDDHDVKVVLGEDDLGRGGCGAGIAGELDRISKRRLGAARQGQRESGPVDCNGADSAPAAGGERSARVEKVPRPGDDLRTARRIIASAALGPIRVRNGVGPVERVIERAPARIGGVQRITGIHHRHDELRAGNGRDLRVDIGGRDGEIRSFRQEIADLLQEGLIGPDFDRGAVFAIPGIKLLLEVVAPGEKSAVLRREIMNKRRQGGKETVRIDVGAGHRLVDQEAVEARIDLQIIFLNAVHAAAPVIFLPYVQQVGAGCTRKSVQLPPTHADNRASIHCRKILLRPATAAWSGGQGRA